MKVIPQKRVVRTKFDIYVFILVMNQIQCTLMNQAHC